MKYTSSTAYLLAQIGHPCAREVELKWRKKRREEKKKLKALAPSPAVRAQDECVGEEDA